MMAHVEAALAEAYVVHRYWETDTPSALLEEVGSQVRAVATDGRVAENVVSEVDANETFTERAIRTRVINRLHDYGPTVYASFCVGQPDPIADVVGHVIEEFQHYDDLVGVQAQSVVYASLRRHYPCDPDREK